MEINPGVEESISPAIGGVITGGTTGSILFVGSGSTFAQDNANLFWDDTNNRLGVGTSSPSNVISISGVPRIFGTNSSLYVTNAQNTNASYSNKGGSSPRSSFITVTTNLGVSGTGGIQNMVDGVRGTLVWFFNGETVDNTKFIKFDFGANFSPVITEATYYQQLSTAQGVWQWQGSNDNSSWTNIGAGTAAMGGSTAAIMTTLSGNTTPYRYYKMLGVSGGTSGAPYGYEMEFKVGYGPHPYLTGQTDAVAALPVEIASNSGDTVIPGDLRLNGNLNFQGLAYQAGQPFISGTWTQSANLLDQSYTKGKTRIGGTLDDATALLKVQGVTWITDANPLVFGSTGVSQLLNNIYQYIVGDQSGDHMTFGSYTDFIWKTTPPGSVGGTERMRLTAGGLGIGTASPNANAVLDVTSTTKAFMPPRMTTTQKNAIASPTAGMVVYDTTLNKLSVYTTAWETIASV